MTRAKAWSKEELLRLEQLWLTTPIGECSEILGRATSSIHYQVSKNGFKRSTEYMNTSSSGRFQKGIVPWNKGKKGWQAGGNSKKTQFKRGHGNSNNAHPVGTDVIDSYGVTHRKVQANGERSEKWRPLKDLVYEEYFGEIPADKIVNFKDGNRQNHSPANLVALTRSEMMRRNTIHRYGAEYASVAFKLGWFKRKIKQVEDNEECE